MFKHAAVHIPGARPLLRLSFVWWHLTFVNPQYGPCNMSLFWHTEYFR